MELPPVVISASKDKTAQNRTEETYWKLEQFGQGDNFHIRGGQLVDAIIFRHDYLQQHPGKGRSSSSSPSRDLAGSRRP